MDVSKTKKRLPQPAKRPPVPPVPKVQVAPARSGSGTPTPPEAAEPQGKRWSWLAALLASAAVLGGTAYIALARSLTGVELHIFRFINDWPDRLRGVFVVATMAPESLWIAVAVVIVTFLLKMYRLAWQLSVGTLAGYVASYLLKHYIARARPGELVHDVSARVHETSTGFPSGHTMIITIIVLLLWPYVPRLARWFLVLLIPLMALSRIYLGVHAPLDVVGGFALGVLVVACMRLLPYKLRNFLHFD